MKWMIAVDSACDCDGTAFSDSEIGFASVPFVISVGSQEFIDTETIDIEAMVDAMETCPEASHTACPSPEAWYHLFEKADKLIAITISEKLSGSYNSAVCAKRMIHEQFPEKKIFVMNSRSTGPAMVLYAEKARELIEQGLSFKVVKEKLHEMVKQTHTVFGLCSFNNLVKNGRVSRLAGLLAGKLGLWGIGIGSAEGTIHMKSKVRGETRALRAFIDDLKENGFNGGKVFISYCQNSELAEKLKEQILGLWKTAKVEVMPTRGLCSFYAERKGLIVSYYAG